MTYESVYVCNINIFVSYSTFSNFLIARCRDSVSDDEVCSPRRWCTARNGKRLTLLQSLLRDPVRLVRLDAAYALRDELHSPQHPLNPTLRKEVVEWLDQSADTALGALRRADWALLEHEPTAVQHIERALRFAPDDAALLREAAALLRSAGQAARAAEVLQRAASLPQR